MPLIADIDVTLIEKYGSFGLLAIMVLSFVFYGLPYFLRKHTETITQITGDAKIALATQSADSKEAINALVETFKSESEACRKERMEAQQLAAAEREKDREARHADRNAANAVLSSMQVMQAEQRRGGK